MPKSSTPALFEAMVRFLVPFLRTAAIRFSGIPHRPKPPIRIVAPSRSRSIAASALATRLSIYSFLPILPCALRSQFTAIPEASCRVDRKSVVEGNVRDIDVRDRLDVGE